MILLGGFYNEGEAECFLSHLKLNLELSLNHGFDVFPIKGAFITKENKTLKRWEVFLTGTCYGDLKEMACDDLGILLRIILEAHTTLEFTLFETLKTINVGEYKDMLKMDVSEED